MARSSSSVVPLGVFFVCCIGVDEDCAILLGFQRKSPKSPILIRLLILNLGRGRNPQPPSLSALDHQSIELVYLGQKHTQTDVHTLVRGF